MHTESGQGSVEWIAVILVVGAMMSAALATVPNAIQGFVALPRMISCAIIGGCKENAKELKQAYGNDLALQVRLNAPMLAYTDQTLTLPVDFRGCRSHTCSDAANRAGFVSNSTRGGQPATAFTHVVDNRAQGGDLFIQYWFYYPDSTWKWKGKAMGLSKRFPNNPLLKLGSKLVPGYHDDDWESYQVRVQLDGRAYARASAHHGYAGIRQPHTTNWNEAPPSLVNRLHAIPGVRSLDKFERNDAWTPSTNWTEITRGSHAGHLITRPGKQRMTDGTGLNLVPLEPLANSGMGDKYHFSPTPPWQKGVYSDPTRDDT